MQNGAQTINFNPTETYTLSAIPNAPAGAVTGNFTPFALGTVATTHDGNVFRFCLADAALTVGLVYEIDTDYGVSTALVAGMEVGTPVGVPTVAVTSGDYFWLQVAGSFEVVSAGAITAGAAIYSSATAGKVDDSSSAQKNVVGLTAVDSAAGADETITCYSPDIIKLG